MKYNFSRSILAIKERNQSLPKYYIRKLTAKMKTKRLLKNEKRRG